MPSYSWPVIALPGPATFTNTLPNNDTADFGVDFDVLDNFPKSHVLASGFRNLGNALARRLQTPARFLHDAFGGDPDYGYDLRSQLNRATSLDGIAAIEAAVKDQVERDARVESAEVKASFDLAASTLSVAIDVQTAAGPFSLVLSVSDVTTELVLSPG